jgi:hypothetical protein
MAARHDHRGWHEGRHRGAARTGNPPWLHFSGAGTMHENDMVMM